MAEGDEVAVPETKKKNKLFIWIILGASILLLGGGGFLARNYFGGGQPAEAAPAPKRDGATPISRVKSVMILNAFLVNLADTESTRFVKVTFRLGLDEANLGDEYAKDPVVLSATRDKINAILSSKTSDELLKPEGKDQLRKEIREQVNSLLPKGEIVEIFIMELIVQL
jgi:flagellar protein FliL